MRTPDQAYDELAQHPHADKLADLVHAAVVAAADERRSSLSDGLEELTKQFEIDHAQAETSYGNAIKVLEGSLRPGAGAADRTLLSALFARGIGRHRPEAGDPTARLATNLLWLAANTPVDALPYVDRALGEEARTVWEAVGQAVRAADAGEDRAISRGESLVGVVGLRSSTHPAAAALASELSTQLRDPLARSVALSAEGAKGPEASAKGEIVPPPRNPVWLFLLTITGLIVLVGLGRAVMRFLFRVRRAAELTVSKNGVTIVSQTQLFGRTLRERKIEIPAEALIKAVREVRYPSLPHYAGAAMLVIGSYIGIRTFIEGARAGSPEMLGAGVIAILLGLLIDYALSHVGSLREGRCRVVFFTRKGAPLAVGRLDPRAADSALTLLSPR